MKILQGKSGFTLAELLIATALLTVILTGVMVTFFRCLELNEVSANTSKAVLAARARMAQIEGTNYSQVNATFDNVTFNVSGLNGKGVTYVDDSVPNILTVTTVVCWRQKSNRLYGEDANLNGVLNGGEDTNGNGRLDSIVQFETQRFNL